MNYLHSSYLQIKYLKQSGLRSEFVQGKPNELKEFILTNKLLALDCETTGLDPHTDTISLVQLSNSVDTHIVAKDQLRNLLSLMNQQQRSYIIHNAKFDLKFLFKNGLRYDKVEVKDTFLISVIINNSARKVEYTLSSQLLLNLGIELSKEDQKLWIGLDYRNITGRLIEYATKDVLHLHKLINYQKQLVVEYDLLETVKLEMQFVKSLALIELNGLLLDKTIWQHNLNNNVETQQRYLKALHEVCLDPIAVS